MIATPVTFTVTVAAFFCAFISGSTSLASMAAAGALAPVDLAADGLGWDGGWAVCASAVVAANTIKADVGTSTRKMVRMKPPVYRLWSKRRAAGSERLAETQEDLRLLAGAASHREADVHAHQAERREVAHAHAHG